MEIKSLNAIGMYATIGLIRLLNAFSAQVETMRRLRSCGTQVIRIERVEVKEGGQAVIGNLRAVPSAHDR
jgi:hypothetical protein